tara:strand:- start:1983 stop:2159 length:177 start_codon:yes stop_codon:yes gene_type:complete
LLNNKNLTSEKIPIIIKNFGQIYLRRIEASFGDVKLLIAGAIRDDWNNIIPIINPEIM